MGTSGDCGLDAWVAAGKADPRRLASFRRLLASRTAPAGAARPEDQADGGSSTGPPMRQ
jgi:ribosome biogenesis GTPase